MDRLFNDASRVPPFTVHDENEDGDNILLLAAKHGHLDIAQRCVWWGFNLNHRNKNDETAILLAVKNGHDSVVHFLLDSPVLAAKDNKFKAKQLLIKAQDMAIMATAATRKGHHKYSIYVELILLIIIC